MEYYIGNRGDERKWNKRTESSRSTDVKSSLLGCLVVRGSVSTEHGGSLLRDPPQYEHLGGGGEEEDGSDKLQEEGRHHLPSQIKIYGVGF